MRKRLLWVLGLVALGLVLASCASNASQDTLKPAGPYAREIKNLFVPIFWIAVAVFVLVEGGILLIAIKYRRRRNRERMPTQTHGNTRLEVAWTILPAIVIAGVMVPTIATIWDLAAKPPPGSLNITVQGRQWWWAFEYTDPEMKTGYGDNGPITTADVMVIPAGRPVYLSLESMPGPMGGSNPGFAVIHSFWVPELAGKQDVVPGRINNLLIQADQPGTYEGQCAEFCGLQHGKMKLRVVALAQSDWNAWVSNQRQPAATPQGPLAAKGMQLFANGVSNGGQCVACHTVGGINSGVTDAPNLTHFADQTHQCFAGCDWNTADTAALEAWLRDPNAVKLGAKMPNYQLTDDEISALVAYLQTLS